MGKSINSWMCYTNPFTGPETWAGFEVSHSYPFCLICLCQRAQTARRRMRSTLGELSFHRFLEWARSLTEVAFLSACQASTEPNHSAQDRLAAPTDHFVSDRSVSTSTLASHGPGRQHTRGQKEKERALPPVLPLISQLWLRGFSGHRKKRNKQHSSPF